MLIYCLPMSTRVSVINIIITNAEGKYLLQMRDGGKAIRDPLHWGFFGGGIEPNESPSDAALRELREELGIDVPTSIFHTIGSVQARADKIVHVVEMDNPITWKDLTVLEGAGAGFFKKEEILQLNLSQTAKAVVRLLFYSSEDY